MRPFSAFLILPALVTVLPAQETTAIQTQPEKMTDPQAEALARQAITLQDPVSQAAALAKLRAHRFKTSRIKERELVL